MKAYDLNSPQFQDAEIARQHLEARFWPEGAVCPHCSSKTAYKLTAKPDSKKPVRPGVWKCAECREQFTITIGTIFEDSKIPLNKWLLAIHLLCASKKGMSAHQLHRMLGVAYKTAWFMAHRIRYAMSQPPYLGKLDGVVEADETYTGGTQKYERGRQINKKKRPVFSIVKRGGDVRSFHVERVTAENLVGIIRENVSKSAHISTDEFAAYQGLGVRFAAHVTVNHSKGEYKKGYAHTNTLEGYFSLLKRGLRMEPTITSTKTTYTATWESLISGTTIARSRMQNGRIRHWLELRVRGFNYGNQATLLAYRKKPAAKPLYRLIAAVVIYTSATN